jgi:hypothetical protein
LITRFFKQKGHYTILFFKHLSLCSLSAPTLFFPTVKRNEENK